MKNEQISLKDLQRIPGVGKSIAQDLYNLGYRSVTDLRGENPEQMYQKSCEKAGSKIDPCLLYVYRCAVYFATEKKPKTEKLKWWYWKDGK